MQLCRLGLVKVSRQCYFSLAVPDYSRFYSLYYMYVCLFSESETESINKQEGLAVASIARDVV